MKQKRLSILIFLIMLILPTTVNAAKNPYPHYEYLGGLKLVNCTWYAWQEAYDKTGVALPLWGGHAGTWYSSAKKKGLPVGTTPKERSIVVYNYGGDFGGHVAYVTKVDGNKMTINEAGAYDFDFATGNIVAANGTGIRNGSVVSTNGEEEGGFLVGFIYLDEIKTTTTTTTKKTTTTTKKTTTTTKHVTTTSTTTTSTTPSMATTTTMPVVITTEVQTTEVQTTEVQTSTTTTTTEPTTTTQSKTTKVTQPPQETTKNKKEKTIKTLAIEATTVIVLILLIVFIVKKIR